MHVPLSLVGFPEVGLLLGRFCSSLDREDIRFELPVRVCPPFQRQSPSATETKKRVSTSSVRTVIKRSELL